MKTTNEIPNTLTGMAKIKKKKKKTHTHNHQTMTTFSSNKNIHTLFVTVKNYTPFWEMVLKVLT